MLGISEYKVRNFIKRGAIEVVDRTCIPMLIAVEDVEILALQNADKWLPNRFKHVGIVGGSDHLVDLLRVMGMRPTTHDTVLGAVNAAHPDDQPILVIVGKMPDTEENLLNTLRDKVVYTRVYKEWQARDAARWCADAVKQRIEDSRQKW